MRARDLLNQLGLGVGESDVLGVVLLVRPGEVSPDSQDDNVGGGGHGNGGGDAGGVAGQDLRHRKEEKRGLSGEK